VVGRLEDFGDGIALVLIGTFDAIADGDEVIGFTEGALVGRVVDFSEGAALDLTGALDGIVDVRVGFFEGIKEDFVVGAFEIGFFDGILEGFNDLVGAFDDCLALAGA
jgi:hypothetical protein